MCSGRGACGLRNAGGFLPWGWVHDIEGFAMLVGSFVGSGRTALRVPYLTIYIVIVTILAPSKIQMSPVEHEATLKV